MLYRISFYLHMHLFRSKQADVNNLRLLLYSEYGNVKSLVYLYVLS